jgi:tRNA threonylcarbamoyladenosine biosynthesis protein TsaB
MNAKILGFDASGPGLSAGYLINGEAVADLYWAHPKSAGSHLAPWLEMLTDEFGRPDAVAVGIGPGSFTGVRIAVSAAKALAYAWRIPAVGVSSLQAWAYSVPAPPGRVLVTTEKRGPAFYAGLYFCGGNIPEPLAPDWAANGDLPGEFPLHDAVGVLGPLSRDPGWMTLISRKAVPLDYPLLGSRVALLAQSRVQWGQWEEAMDLAPSYIRPPAISSRSTWQDETTGKDDSKNGNE